MATLSPHRIFVLLGLFLFAGMLGCSHCKTNRGHLFRCDWAFEYNRTPWVGCPPDSGCDEDNGDPDCNDCKKDGKKSCLKHKGCFRRHCGLASDCTAKHPCCKTLGCGMWIDPSDPNSLAALNPQTQGVKACGLTPLCSPMKPCGLTPFCGRAVNQSFMNQQGLGRTIATPMMGETVQPTPINAGQKGQNTKTGTQPPNGAGMPPVLNSPNGQPALPAPVIARPNTPLVSMGIVPGISRTRSGGAVVASGVVTPFGRMMPNGVQLPNGTINPNAVIQSCLANGNCTPAHPCGITPGCGGLVAVSNVVPAPNAMLASAYSNAGAIMPASGLFNPFTGQPIRLMSGLSMSGNPQTGYPPIGYAANGYASVNPQQLAALQQHGFIPQNQSLGQAQVQAQVQLTEEEEYEEEEESEVEDVLPVGAEKRSKMPVPRFHPVPTKPVFQRSKGLPVVKPAAETEAAPVPKKIAALSRRLTVDDSEEEDEKPQYKDTDSAYLAGMSAAMNQVEKELSEREQELEKKKKQADIIKRAEELQAKMDKQREDEKHLQKEAEEREQVRLLAAQKQKKVEEQQQAEWEEAVQNQLAAAKLKEERLKKQLQYREKQLRQQAELNETLLAKQAQALPQAVKRQTQTPAQMQMMAAAAVKPVPTAVQPVSYAAVNHTAQPAQNKRAASIPAAMPKFAPVDEAGGLFVSALKLFRGNGLPSENPQESQDQQIHVPQAQRHQAGGNVIGTAKSAGAGLVSVLNGAAKPLVNFLSDKPSENQAAAERQAAVETQAAVESPPNPTAPPKPQKMQKVRSANIEEDEPVIRLI